MAIANNPVAINQKSFRCAVDAKIEAQHSVTIIQAERIRIAQRIQPGHRLLAIVFVVQPYNTDALLCQRIKIAMLGTAGWTPGRPDVQQQRLTGNQRLLIIGLTRFIQRLQPENGQGLANQS